MNQLSANFLRKHAPKSRSQPTPTTVSTQVPKRVWIYAFPKAPLGTDQYKAVSRESWTSSGKRNFLSFLSFARPSCLDPTRIGGGSWVTCCCKTVHTLVRRMAILAESVQLWPMTSENSSSQIFLNCHRMDGRPCLRLGSVEKFCCHSLVGVHVLVAAAQEFC